MSRDELQREIAIRMGHMRGEVIRCLYEIDRTIAAIVSDEGFDFKMYHDPGYLSWAVLPNGHKVLVEPPNEDGQTAFVGDFGGLMVGAHLPDNLTLDDEQPE